MTKPFTTMKLDSSGDLSTREKTPVDSGNSGLDIQLIDQKESIAQSLSIILKTRLTEDVISPHIGIPIANILGIFEPGFVGGTIRRAVLQDPRLVEAEVDLEERTDEERRKRILRITINAKTVTDEELEEIIEVAR